MEHRRRRRRAGRSTNGITLGSTGAVGTLTPYFSWTDTTHAITLNGEGGLFTSSFDCTLNAPISGSGQLILASGGFDYLTSTIPNSSFTGTTVVWSQANKVGCTGGWNSSSNISTADILGSGNVRIEYGGMLFVNAASNLGTSATVFVGGYNPTNLQTGILSRFESVGDFVPNYTSDSSGVAGFEGTSSTNVNARLAYGQAPLGDGQMIYGTRTGWTFTGSSLMADETNHTYYFNSPWAWITINTSVLNDNDGTDSYGVNLYGYMFLNSNNNRFSENTDHHQRATLVV